MARSRKRMPLYEVMRLGRPKSSPDKGLEQPESADVETSAQEPSKPEAPAYVWPRKPKPVQFTGEKVEISVPYQVAIAAVLAAVLLMLGAFRLGQWHTTRQQGIIHGAEKVEIERVPDAPKPSVLPGLPAETRVEKPPKPRSERIRMVEPRGDHRIVIQQYKIRADLVPAQEYFANYGIETEIQQRDNVYFLVTKNLYENPERQGTDGYEIKQRIRRLGASYKAPAGHESFAPNFFRDAYGEKAR